MPSEDKNSGTVELPAQVYFQILEIALKTGKSEEEVLAGLLKSALDLMDAPPGVTQLQGFALEAKKALGRNENGDVSQ